MTAPEPVAPPAHNHVTRDVKPRGQCPRCDVILDKAHETLPVAPPAQDELWSAIRETLDDEVLTRTGRSVGDIASAHVTDALLAGPLAGLVARAETAEAKVARVEALAAELDDRGVKALVEGSYWPDESPQRYRLVGRSVGYRVAADDLRAALGGDV